MIDYIRHTLDNGLRVLLHRDDTTPLATVNLLYCVGARDENPDRTGFAHLFEHLMFGGTRQYPDYDLVVDSLGGENNAFTNNDYTNYYLTVPAENLRQALLLEANRMRGDWNIQDGQWSVLDVQRRVVTEEYNQRYINQPYGDVWMLLRPLCYKRHPYRWCTIGADIRHVQEATLQDVKPFFDRFYRPDNAILSIAGNIDTTEALRLVEEAFGSIPAGCTPPPTDVRHRVYPTEEPQHEARKLVVERPVPNNALYKAWVMCDRWDADFYAYDMLSDLLSNGHSSRLYRRAVQELGLFSEINAYITGDLGPGLFAVSGKLCDGVEFSQAEEVIDSELERLRNEAVTPKEIEKVANKYENTFLFSQYKASDRALGLCYYEMLGHPELVNEEPQNYRRIPADTLARVAGNLTNERSSTLYIVADNRQPEN